MAAPLYVTQSGRLWHAGLILIVTVGLPGECSSLGAAGRRRAHPMSDSIADDQPEERHICPARWNATSAGWESRRACMLWETTGERC